MGKILIGIFFIIGGLSGTMVLRGTQSSGALAAVGVGLVIWGVIQMATGKSGGEQDVEVKPIVDENMEKINKILANKESLSAPEVDQKLRDFLDSMSGSIQKMDDYYKVSRTMKEIQKRNLLPANEFQKRSDALEALHDKLQIEELINKKAKPLIDALAIEKSNGSISEEEFLGKQETILKETRLEVEEDIRTRPSISDIDEKMREKLSGPKLFKVESFLKRMEKGNVIALYNNSHVKLFSQVEWKSIIESNNSDKYEKIHERV
jgi:hypothetical protein